jgi:uncharacterized protein YndB with AHSA1/START domain
MGSDRDIARAKVEIDASPEEVWDALIDPDRIEQYMFGTRVSTDWEVGSPISWRGEWQGKQYEDKGEILDFEPERKLRYSHFSPLAGKPDLPENYHTVMIELTPTESGTTVDLAQDNNETDQARAHSEANWQSMLDGLRSHVEAGAGGAPS